MGQSLQLTATAVSPAGHCNKDRLDGVTVSLEVLNLNAVSMILRLFTSTFLYNSLDKTVMHLLYLL